MIGLADINKSGEELTKEVQEGINKASTKDGFEYHKSPVEFYSKLDSIQKKLGKLDAFCATYSQMQSELREFKSYSKVTTWNELLLKIPKIIYDFKFSDPNLSVNFKQWMDDFQSVATEDGLRMALGDLEVIIDHLPEVDKDLLCTELNSIFKEYHDAGGELFVIHNYKDVGMVPFSKSEPTHIIEPEVVNEPEHRPIPTTYSRTRIHNSIKEPQVETESYGSKLKRMFGRR